jgi:hypothetical protein
MQHVREIAVTTAPNKNEARAKTCVFGENDQIQRVMLANAVRALIVLLLPAFVTYAEAQPVIATPRISAPPPLPHFSPPARLTVPNLPPPASRLGAPSLSTPSLRPAVPHGIQPQMFNPHITTLGHHNWMTPDTHPSLRSDPEASWRSPVQSALPQTRGTNTTLILRNPVFANLASRNPATRSLARSTFHGNFAGSDLAREEDQRHHRRHFVVGCAGPLFWPYAFNDLIDFTFWPYAYDTFWPRAFDDVFAGIYGAYAPQYYPSEYGAPAGGYSEICSGPAQVFIDFPIKRIVQQVEPDQHQQTLLDDLKAATAKVVTLLQDACPSELPSTPTGRMAAMRTRVEAMLQAVKIARPALETFYQSLTDEQKERFNAIDQDTQTADRRLSGTGGLCGGQWARDVAPPIDQVERTLRLSNEQDSAFRDLTEASARAAELLKASCQPEQAITPTGRLADMEERLNLILQAVNTVQTPLERFYQSLSDEQKARFNRLGALHS